MQVVNQVNSTNDYSKFKIMKGNRNVNKLHVKRLKESFKEKYLLTPIVVNQDYEIIDGQHRFQAAKEMNLPVNFIICNDYSLKEVQLLNTNMKNWKKEDYLNAYCDLGYPSYLKFREFMYDYPDFGLSAVEVILTQNIASAKHRSSKIFKSESNKKGSYAIRYFQEGDLEIPDYDLSVEHAEKILMLKPYYDGYNRALFVRAIIGIFRIEYYSHSRFIARLSSNPNALEHCSNITQYKLMIEDIYNYRSREKVSLRF